MQIKDLLYIEELQIAKQSLRHCTKFKQVMKCLVIQDPRGFGFPAW